MTADLKSLLQTVWCVTNRFLKEWKAEPYFWAREIDIQAELACRLRCEAKAANKDAIKARFNSTKHPWVNDSGCHHRILGVLGACSLLVESSVLK